MNARNSKFTNVIDWANELSQYISDKEPCIPKTAACFVDSDDYLVNCLENAKKSAEKWFEIHVDDMNELNVYQTMDSIEGIADQIDDEMIKIDGAEFKKRRLDEPLNVDWAIRVLNATIGRIKEILDSPC